LRREHRLDQLVRSPQTLAGLLYLAKISSDFDA
jgi:hypothetical protein